MLEYRLLIVFICAAFGSARMPMEEVRPGKNLPQVVDDLPNDFPINYRLPSNTRPISYDVHLKTNIHLQTDFNFTGTVVIRLVVIEASRTITLHQRQLTLGPCSLVLASSPNTAIALHSFEYNFMNEFLTFTLLSEELLVASEYILTITYREVLQTDAAGFHRTSYQDDYGNDRWLAITHFEATFARHAFPCYDEPALRSLFTIRITHGSTYHALSNMPVVSLNPVVNEPDLMMTQFDVTSGPTPTYLIAFVVSDFDFKSRSNAAGFVQRIFARPNAIDTVDFGLDTGLKVLDAFEQYFGIAFAFPKMDQVAVPNFARGAMENWGLVTYREGTLLYNESISSSFDKFELAKTIAHEYAHQWFGNLVTPTWWTYVWLNEGFATLFSYYALDSVFPEWNTMDDFVPMVLQEVMLTDATEDSRPMTNYVESLSEISSSYNWVIYQKAGCVLRMLLNAFTEESFKRGLIKYLKSKAYSSASEEDLFAALDKAVKADQTLAAQHDVATIFSSWTQQAGFPLVVVDRNYDNSQITLSQERYQTVVNATTRSSSLWWIPINLATASEANFHDTAAIFWFANRSHTFKDASVGQADWLLLNKQQTGYYRVQYDRENYKLLADQLAKNFSEINLVSRSNLIDDAFDLARVGRLDYDVVLDLTKYMVHELECVPWASFFRGLELVDRLYAESNMYDKFKSYIRNQLANIYKELRFTAIPNEHYFRKQERNPIIDWSCHYGNIDCLDDTNAMLDGYLSHGLKPHHDHWDSIYSNGGRKINVEQFIQIDYKFIVENDFDERLRLINALSFDSNADRIQLLLKRSVAQKTYYFDDESDRLYAFHKTVTARPEHILFGFDFMLDNLDAVNVTYGTTNLNEAIKLLSSLVVNSVHAEKLQKLVALATSNEYITQETIDDVRNNLEYNLRWIARNVPVIDMWIDLNSGDQVIASALLIAFLLIISL